MSFARKLKLFSAVVGEDLSTLLYHDSNTTHCNDFKLLGQDLKAEITCND